MRLPVLCLAFLLMLSACRKEEKITFDESAKLQFSADTILFDTVFTSIGSTSRRLKIYNRNENAVRISEIALAGAAGSSYQININGQPVNKAANLELAGKDSLNIFIKVSIDPGAASLPFVVADSLSFLTNGNRQSVQLRAYGQNARFINGGTINGHVTWDNQLPYVIYNSALINEGSTLSIEKGARLYFHKDSRLLVAGTLKASGDLDKPVSFMGDRLEHIYTDEPGQWGGIHFLRQSRDNILHFVNIKNAIVGIRVDSLSNNSNPKVIISNSVIYNMEVAGLLMYNADVSAFNNLVYNCGQFLVYGALGGNYNFKQNTFAGMNFMFARQGPAVYFSDFFVADNSMQTAPLNVNMVNNIIWGSNDNELLIEKKGSGDVSLSLNNNLLKTTDIAFNINGNLLNMNPLFADAAKGNYMLTVNSPALNKGLSLSPDRYFTQYLSTDIKKITRIFPSELGCYEF
ncbi:MAG TPA: hypothetical protein VLZ28_09500 [Daejeonella sp.]|nr:hypothetical protein [Daejeonella sp.]